LQNPVSGLSGWNSFVRGYSIVRHFGLRHKRVQFFVGILIWVFTRSIYQVNN